MMYRLAVLLYCCTVLSAQTNNKYGTVRVLLYVHRLRPAPSSPWLRVTSSDLVYCCVCTAVAEASVHTIFNGVLIVTAVRGTSEYSTSSIYSASSVFRHTFFVSLLRMYLNNELMVLLRTKHLMRV